MTGALNFMVRLTSELETNIVSVERVKEYSENETEVNVLNLGMWGMKSHSIAMTFVVICVIYIVSDPPNI